MLFSIKTLGSYAFLAVTPFALLECEGKVTIQDHQVGCIKITGGDAAYKLSGGTLSISSGAASISVDQTQDPACEDCRIEGSLLVYIDKNGNGSLDPGEESWPSKISDDGLGFPGAQINLGGVTVSGASSNTTLNISYDIKDCKGGRAARNVKLG